MHKPIQFTDLSLFFSHKTCFTDFHGQITFGNRIAIIGRNGSGKSSLLRLFAGLTSPVEGGIYVPQNVVQGFIPQIVDTFDSLSGGQRFNKLLTQTLTSEPNLLLLDEPTNHLDQENRRSLMKMLCDFSGTLIIVTHDTELLNNTTNTIWHINHQKVNVFSGNYTDYMRKLHIHRTAVEHELARLGQQKKQIHADLMKEQKRAKSRRLLGEQQINQKRWPTIVSGGKARNAQGTAGRKKRALNSKKEALVSRLASLQREETLTPKFVLTSQHTSQNLITITEGSVSYAANKFILQRLSLVIKAQERVAIHGANGSGKSTLIKAILGNASLITTGSWHVPQRSDIGYLDQHYHNLHSENTVWQTLSYLLPNRSYTEIRTFLNDFLFRKNEEVEALITTLSGGEKVRLSLAQLAAQNPRLLILDEITNNLDKETREQVLHVLSEYPGAMMVISHDADFLAALGITTNYEINNGFLK